MDKVLAILNNGLKDLLNFRDNHLLASPEKSPYSLFFDYTKWDYDQLWDVENFVFKEGITPFSNLGTVIYSWIAYFVVIMSIRFIMQFREGFKLKYVTAIHNLILCLGSLAMCIPTVMAFVRGVSMLGTRVICFSDENNTIKRGLGFYCVYVFYLSKFYELFDTVILVLKKKPVIFLHWYHHAIVILTCWTWLHYQVTFSIAPTILNTFVHVFMYYYYFASSLGYNVWYRQYITMLQITQFATLGALALTYIYYSNKYGCDESVPFWFSVVVNVSFFMLFVQFYVANYIKKGKKSVKAVNEAEKVKGFKKISSK